MDLQEPGLADEELGLPRIRMGICAMDRKARSKPMRAILDRLHAFGEFDIVVFGDKTILEAPISEWPRCDCLLSWHSDGFPLAKVSQLKSACWTSVSKPDYSFQMFPPLAQP